jgi:hypothetical protein
MAQNHTMRTVAFAALLIAYSASSASARVVNAVQPPNERCRPASKVEYNSAKRQYLLQNRFGIYVRTGRFWRHHYWYCRQ